MLLSRGDANERINDGAALRAACHDVRTNGAQSTIADVICAIRVSTTALILPHPRYEGSIQILNFSCQPPEQASVLHKNDMKKLKNEMR